MRNFKAPSDDRISEVSLFSPCFFRIQDSPSNVKLVAEINISSSTKRIACIRDISRAEEDEIENLPIVEIRSA